MTLLRRRFLPLLLASALALPACGSDDATAPDDPLAPFLGTWIGVSMLFTATATGAQVDAILAGGSLTVSITEAGRFTLSLSIPPFVNQQDAGTFSVSGNQMTMETDGEPVPISGSFSFSQGGDRLTLDATQGVGFDFDQNGEDEPATLVMVLQKQ